MKPQECMTSGKFVILFVDKFYENNHIHTLKGHQIGYYVQKMLVFVFLYVQNENKAKKKRYTCIML